MNYSNEEDILSTASTIASVASQASSLIKTSSASKKTDSPVAVQSKDDASQNTVSVSEEPAKDNTQRISAENKSNFTQVKDETFESTNTQSTAKTQSSVKKKTGGAKNKTTYKGEDLSTYSDSTVTTQSLGTVNVKINDTGLSVGQSFLASYAETPGYMMRKGFERVSRKVSESLTKSVDEALFAKRMKIRTYQMKGDTRQEISNNFSLVGGLYFNITNIGYDQGTNTMDTDTSEEVMVEFSSDLLAKDADKKNKFEKWLKKQISSGEDEKNSPEKSPEANLVKDENGNFIGKIWDFYIVIEILTDTSDEPCLALQLGFISKVTRSSNSDVNGARHYENYQITGSLRFTDDFINSEITYNENWSMPATWFSDKLIKIDKPKVEKPKLGNKFYTDNKVYSDGIQSVSGKDAYINGKPADKYSDDDDNDDDDDYEEDVDYDNDLI